MASEAISSSILLIGAIVGAAFLVTAILPAIFQAGDTFGTVSSSAETKMKTDFRIVNTFASDTGIIKVWMKNVGANQISEFDIKKSDVYYGKTTSISRYSWGGTPAFTYALGDATNNGFWDIGETLEIQISGLTITNGDILSFTFSLPNSVRRSISFSTNT